MAGSLSSIAVRHSVARDHREWGSETRDWVLDRVRAGDPSAVTAVYDRHHEAVRAFAAHLLHDEAAAEDLVHEVFVTLPRAIRRFRGGASLRTFLIGIAANHARHYVRAAARRRAAYDRLSRQVEPAAMTPESLCERRELATLLERALDTLPLKQRVVFVLCDVEDRTSADVAEILGIPPATVRTRLFHARRKLRGILEGEVCR